MIVGIIGKRGCGKTITMAKTVVDMLDKGKTIYTNFHINKKGIKKKYHNKINLLDSAFFKNYKDFKLYNCALFLDEIYVYIDSRTSSSKRNRLWSYFINQTRKRDVDLYFTTQFFRQVELRLRENTEYFIFPQIIKQANSILIYNKIYSYGDSLKRIGNERFIGNDYFNVYDTDEIISFDDDEKTKNGNKKNKQ